MWFKYILVLEKKRKSHSIHLQLASFHSEIFYLKENLFSMQYSKLKVYIFISLT